MRKFGEIVKSPEKVFPMKSLFLAVADHGGIEITIRFIARKGRQSRIAIIAPAGAVFRAAERDEAGPASGER